MQSARLSARCLTCTTYVQATQPRGLTVCLVVALAGAVQGPSAGWRQPAPQRLSYAAA
jgi:hypothetical protein